MSGFILFFTSADEAVKGNESCRNPATNWKSMGAGEITWPWRMMKCLKTIPMACKIPEARKIYTNVWNGTMAINLWSSIFPNSTLKVLHFSSNPAETGRLPIPCRTTARRTASIILTTWWKKLVKQLSCQEFTPTTRSVPQQSPSGRMLKSVTAISWRFPAHYNSRPSTISFCTAAKSFPAVSKGPRH